jgi:hypothetical protein
VGEWNDEVARDFAQACATHVSDRAAGRAAEYAADATAASEGAVAADSAAVVAYMAAHAAEVMIPGGFALERRWQSQWVAERVGVRAVYELDEARDSSTPPTPA